MRILHIDPDDLDNPVSGGGPVRTYEICKRLVQMGHEVTVITPTFPGSTPEKVRDGIRYIRAGRRIGDHGSSHHITFFFSAPRLIKELPHDILIEDFMPPMGATFTPRYARTPLVASVQWFSVAAWQKQYKLPFVWGQKKLIKNYQNFVVLTEKMRANLQRQVPLANMCTIPNAVSEGFFNIEPRYGDFILFVGRVDMRDKGVDLMLQAFAKIPTAMRIPLVIAGHGWEFNAMDSLARALDITKWIHFVGRKSPQEVMDLYQDCRFACVPSRVETFGIVIIEAMAACKPVVLFDHWPMNEVASGVGCLKVPAFDVDKYSQSMQSLLLASESELHELGRKNRTASRLFSWDVSAKRQEAFYLKALEQYVQ